MAEAETMTLWRPAGPEGIALVEAAEWSGSPRLPEQPIFHPVNEDYAIRIARDWNVPASSVGYVTGCHADAGFASRAPARQAGAETIPELWELAEGLEDSHRHLGDRIEVVHEFRP